MLRFIFPPPPRLGMVEAREGGERGKKQKVFWNGILNSAIVNLHSRLIRNYNNPARYIADPWVEVIIVSIVVVKDFGEGKATGVMSRGLVRISAFGDDPSSTCTCTFPLDSRAMLVHTTLFVAVNSWKAKCKWSAARWCGSVRGELISLFMNARCELSKSHF